MEDSTIIKLTAIISLVVLEITNMLTMRLDGNLLLTIGALIGGLAGYEYRKTYEKRRKTNRKHV
jgi:positive regulator of sigma E activity